MSNAALIYGNSPIHFHDTSKKTLPPSWNRVLVIEQDSWIFWTPKMPEKQDHQCEDAEKVL
jgi:hypothetical protein